MKDFPEDFNSIRTASAYGGSPFPPELYTVTLLSVTNKLSLVKTLRTLFPETPLRDIKGWLDNLPKLLQRDLDVGDATALVRVLEASGGVVELHQDHVP